METKEQLNYLLQHNVHFLQGWYFSKALHVEELVRLLQGEKMNKYIGYYFLLVLGISASSFAAPIIEGDYWQCATHDANNTKWLSKNMYQKVALNLSYAACKKTARFPPLVKPPEAAAYNSSMV